MAYAQELTVRLDISPKEVHPRDTITLVVTIRNEAEWTWYELHSANVKVEYLAVLPGRVIDWIIVDTWIDVSSVPTIPPFMGGSKEFQLEVPPLPPGRYIIRLDVYYCDWGCNGYDYMAFDTDHFDLYWGSWCPCP